MAKPEELILDLGLDELQAVLVSAGIKNSNSPAVLRPG